MLLQQKGGGGGAGGGIGGGSGGGGGGGSVEAERKALEAKGASKRAVMWDLGTDPGFLALFIFFCAFFCTIPTAYCYESLGWANDF